MMKLGRPFKKGELYFEPRFKWTYTVTRILPRSVQARASIGNDPRYKFQTSKRQACLHWRPIHESICWVCLRPTPEAFNTLICDNCNQRLTNYKQ